MASRVKRPVQTQQTSEQVNRAVGAAVMRLLDVAPAGADEQAGLEVIAGVWANEGARLIPGTQCVISVVSAERPDVFRVIAGAGEWASALVGQEWPLNPGMLHGRAMFGGKPIETTDAPSQSVAPWVFAGRITTGRLVPIAGGEPLPDGRVSMGVIGFWREGHQPFSEVQRQVIDTYGRLVAMGIMRSEARAATDRLVARLRMSSEVAQEFSMSLDPEQVVETIMRRARDVVRADRITLLAVFDESVAVLSGYDSAGHAAKPGAAQVLSERLREVIDKGLPQVEGRPNLRRASRERQSELRGVRHRLTVPLAAGGRVVAVLRLSRRSDEIFSELDIDNLTQVGTRAALALQNARLFDESRRAKVKALDALLQISQHLEAADTMAELFSHLARTVAELVSARWVAFWRLADDQRSIRVADGTFGLDATALSHLGPLAVKPDGSGTVDRVIFDGLVFCGPTREWEMAAADRAGLDGLGGRDVMALAWKAGDTPLGMLSAYGSTKPDGFGDEDVWILQLASLAAGLVWQLKSAEERLRDMSAAETNMLREHMDRMTTLEQVKSDFLKLASHELRGPLTVVKGYHSMLAEHALDPEQIDQVMPIVEGKLDQMTRLINEMLETARLEEGTAYLDRRRQDLRPILRVAVRSIGPLLGGRHRVSLRMPSKPVLVEADAERIMTIVTNLLDNAVKFSPGGGHIRCQLTTTASVARVHVIDEGLGIPSEDLPRLFTRFGRLVTADNSHIAGTGLGLYISRELARLHGGEITVRSSPRRGTRFIVTLPLAAVNRRPRRSAVRDGRVPAGRLRVPTRARRPVTH